MAILTTSDAKNELKKAEIEFESFLNSVFKSGKYISFENFTSPEQEIKNFKDANCEDKFSLLQKYYNLYQDTNIAKEDRDSLSMANMCVLTSRFVFMGIPTELVDNGPSLNFKDTIVEPQNHYKEALSYITRLRTTKNFDKCEYRGKPLAELLSSIQFSSKQFCSEKDFNTIKNAAENLERYNLANDIISQLEGKVFRPIYEKDFAFKVAQSIKTSKGICSETQLKILADAKAKLITSEGVQLDMLSLLSQDGVKPQNVDREDISR